MAIIKLNQQESALKKEIITILKVTAKNKAFKDITITDVKLTVDNSYATIFWTVYLPNLDIKALSANLERAKGFCRSELAKNSSKYKVPQLRFKYDDTHEHVEKINSILANIKNNNSSEDK